MESVWDYPRPPRVEPCAVRARVQLGGVTIADSTAAVRVLETSQAPAIYFPPADVDMTRLAPTGRRSQCEWKGQASYYDVLSARSAAWSYPDPVPEYAELRDHVAFYAQLMDACFLGEERVDPNQGDFYGGWITSNLVGPFKGAPGTLGW